MGNIGEYLFTFVLLAPPILMAVTIHEVAHGWAAYKFGDPTAKLSGRLTLNPIKHLDLVGTLVFFITRMIGWAKPVPVNAANFRRPRQDMIWVSAAGPASNLALAFVFGLVFQALAPAPGVRISGTYELLLVLVHLFVRLNIGLGVFNLLPVPPLDGSGILAGLLPEDLAREYERLSPYGFVILLVLIFTNAVEYIIYPVIKFLADLFLGGFPG